MFSRWNFTIERKSDEEERRSCGYPEWVETSFEGDLFLAVVEKALQLYEAGVEVRIFDNRAKCVIFDPAEEGFELGVNRLDVEAA